MKIHHIITFGICTLSSLASAQDYAAWNKINTDGKWTQYAEQAIDSSKLTSTIPSDIAQFCPAYEVGDDKARKQFWVGLLSAMAKLESNFKTEAQYTEETIIDRRGKRVISRGLLQISQESANQKAYSCNIKNAEDLHQAQVNLNCGTQIMAYWVKKDNQIAAKSKSNLRGAARYWSILRAWQGKTTQISQFTQSLPACQANSTSIEPKEQ